MKNNPSYWKNAFGKIDKKSTLNKEGLFFLKYLKKNDMIVEAGCGLGSINIKLCALGYKAYGLDFSEDLIKRCKEFVKKEKICSPKMFILGDILDIPLKDNSYDVYISSGVIEHFKAKDQFKIISEAKRILGDGGRVVITVPNAYSPNTISRFFISKFKKYVQKDEMVYQKNISTSKIKKMFERQGFKTIRCFNYGFDKAVRRFFLLGYKNILGIPNPFYYMSGFLLSVAKGLEPVFFKFGETTAYIGIIKKK